MSFDLDYGDHHVAARAFSPGCYCRLAVGQRVSHEAQFKFIEAMAT